MRVLIASLFIFLSIPTATFGQSETKEVFPGANESTPSRSQYFSRINHTNEGQTEEQTLTNPEQVYELAQKLGHIYHTVKDKVVGFTKLTRWYNDVDQAAFKSFKTVANTIENHYETILNFFERRSTNAGAESFNAKIKAFRAQLRGLRNISFFLYRLAKIYG